MCTHAKGLSTRKARQSLGRAGHRACYLSFGGVCLLQEEGSPNAVVTGGTFEICAYEMSLSFMFLLAKRGIGYPGRRTSPSLGQGGRVDLTHRLMLESNAPKSTVIRESSYASSISYCSIVQVMVPSRLP